jgi:hypothetical protein
MSLLGQMLFVICMFVASSCLPLDAKIPWVLSTYRREMTLHYSHISHNLRSEFVLLFVFVCVRGFWN